MAIGEAKKKASAARKTAAPAEKKQAAPLEGFGDRAATLRIYVKDRNLLKEAKKAALDDDTSLSQLWEEWVIDWLDKRSRR